MENKLFYIRGSKTNPGHVKKALLEKYPNMCNQSLVVWTKEDMLIYVDGDDCCSCCSYDSTVGRTLIKYGEEIQSLSGKIADACNIPLTMEILKRNGFIQEYNGVWVIFPSGDDLSEQVYIEVACRSDGSVRWFEMLNYSLSVK